MRPSIIALATLLVLALGAAGAAARCLSYEPAKVTLVGTLTSRTVPGPPGYRSIAHGDYPETIYVLKLDEPICVSGDPTSRRNSKSHSHITEVQLVTPDVDPKRFLRKKVRASGSLFSAQMGHHRTPVVLAVAKLSLQSSGG